MFPIRIRKLDNISVQQTYRWKARFVGFLALYSLSKLTSGFKINKKVTIVVSKLRCTQQNVAARGAMTAAAAAAGQLAIFMNGRHGAVLHRPGPDLALG